MDRHFLISFTLLSLVIVCAAAIEPVNKVTQFKNLQVLPKQITEQALQKIMEVDFNKGLGVNCDYCHAKIAGSTDLDFASDAKGEKEIARSMMRMTIEINKNYFGQVQPMIGDTVLSVNCITCHHGEPYPGTVRGK